MQTAFPRWSCRERQARESKLELDLRQSRRGAFWGCRSAENVLAASMLVSDFEMTMDAQRWPVCGVGAVAVDLLHRKEHLAKALIEKFLALCKQRGAMVALLYPFNIGFYRKMGFGLLTENYRFRFRPEKLLYSASGKCGLRCAQPKDKERVLAFYRAWAARYNGMLVHRVWDELRIFEGKNVVIHCDKSDEIDGYCCWSARPTGPEGFYSSALTIHELVCGNAAALQAFSAMLASLADQFAYVELYTPFQSGHLLAADADSGENDAYRNGIQEYARYCGGCMAKIVDLPAFYRAPIKIGQGLRMSPFTVRLEICDPFSQRAAEEVLLHWEDGCLSARGAEKKPDVTIRGDISDYTSFALGAEPLKTLCDFSRLHVDDPRYLPALQSVLGKTEKPICFTYF